MKLPKYRIPLLSAWSLIGYAKKNGDCYTYELNDTETSGVIRGGENTWQEDTPIFFQAMCILNGEDYKQPQSHEPVHDLSDVLFYMDFSGIFDRKGKTPRHLETLKKAEVMFRPEGIILNFGEGKHRYLAFERSASMSRQSRLSFVREDFYEPLKQRMMLGMKIGMCQLSKLYAYNGLMFTTGKRIELPRFWNSEKIVVVDNPVTPVKDAKIVTVEDDGTDNPVRTYSRVEQTATIDVTEFDGEGIISPSLAEKVDKIFCGRFIHSSFQIRMPYVKGMVHSVDFHGLLGELGVPFIVDIWGKKHKVKNVELILTKSMFKGYGWLTENKMTWEDYISACENFRHSLYISGVGKTKPEEYTELNYQFINTLSMKAEEFRPLDLPGGWSVSPSTDTRHWITKATETAYYDLIANQRKRLSYFTDELDLPENEQDERRVVLAKLLQKNPLFINEPIYADELQKKADKVLDAYAIGRLRIAGDNRYLSGDLMRLLASIAGTAEKYYRHILSAETGLNLECDAFNTSFYAPGAAYPQIGCCTMLRNPHIARNEEAVAMPMRKLGLLRDKYLGHLTDVIMVDSRTLIPERLGGADFDGDMIKTVADPLLNDCVARNYTDKDFDPYNYRNNIPLLKIPAAPPMIRDAEDWQARLETVKATFSSSVGQICNAALDRSIIAYDENSDSEERERCREETETLAILTGLEIDAAKSGVKPDLSAYIGKKKRSRNVFLKYKNIVSGDEDRPWYEQTTAQQLSAFYEKVDWGKVSSNVERLPYLAYCLKQNTPKAPVKPAKDEELFVFATEPNWKDKLDPEMLERVRKLIADYKEVTHRINVRHLNQAELRRRSDIERILFSRGQETEVSADDLYHAFMSSDYTAEKIESIRYDIVKQQWHLMNREEREYFLLSHLMPNDVIEFGEILCDFRHGGYRLLPDVICDIDDLYKSEYLKDINHLPKADDSLIKYNIIMHSKVMEQMVTDKEQIASLVQMTIDSSHISRNDMVKYSVALGERKFVMDSLTDWVEEVAVDYRQEKSHVE